MEDQDRFTDVTIRCRDCARVFVLAAGEQAFFAQKGFTNPKRCLPCRRANRTNQPQEPQMCDTNRAQPPFRTW